MSVVVETSFFHPKNVGFFNSKLRRAADVNWEINSLQPSYCPPTPFVKWGNSFYLPAWRGGKGQGTFLREGGKKGVRHFLQLLWGGTEMFMIQK